MNKQFLKLIFLLYIQTAYSQIDSTELILKKTDAQYFLTQKLDSLSQSNSLAGFAVSIFDKDSILYCKAFGLSNIKTKTPYTINTVQKIASVSKLLLAVSLMKAQELNLLKLDDPVNKYLPFPLINSRVSNSNISIRQLASHTSGLKKNRKYDLKALYFPTKLSKINKELPFGVKKMIMNLFVKIVNKNEYIDLGKFLYKIYNPNGEWYNKRHFYKIDAGKKEFYSNQGASFLALIIEKVSGMKYYEFVEKYILSALEMNNSGFDFEMKNYPKEKKATLYHNNVKVPNDFQLILYPAGGFETNIKDFSKFMKSMANGLAYGNNILSKKSYNEMVQLPDEPTIHHAVLWESYADGSVGHRGDIAGVTTYSYYNIKLDKGYILFSNNSGLKKNYADFRVIINQLKKFYPYF